jgi:hypothetical protein
VIVVGGGSILLSDRLHGFEDLRRPDHLSVANAIRAAIAQVEGEVDRIFAIGALTWEQALEEARTETAVRAVMSYRLR